METKRYKSTLPQVNPENGNDAQRALLQNANKRHGKIANMFRNMVNSPGLMETYAISYDIFRNNSGFSPVEQEVVFLTLTIANGCEYCTAAHSVIADNLSKVPVEITNALRNGELIPDAKLQALSEFTRIMFETRGTPAQEDAMAFLEAGYTEKQILEIILAIAVKTISNYTNHIFETPLDEVFSGRKWSKKENLAA